MQLMHCWQRSPVVCVDLSYSNREKGAFEQIKEIRHWEQRFRCMKKKTTKQLQVLAETEIKSSGGGSHWMFCEELFL